MFFHFLVLLFVPGFALSELLSLYKREDSLCLKLAFIVGMSIAMTTAIFGIWNTFIGAITQQVVGAYTVVSLLAVAFVISVGIFRGMSPSIFGWPKRSDYLVLSAILFLVVLTLPHYGFYFQKYPIFPAYPTTDYIQQTTNALSTLSGKTSLGLSLLYFGVQYQFAIALLGNSTPSIVVVRDVMSIITIVSPLFFYALAEKAFRNRGVGVITVGLYLLGFIWINMVYNSGTYANFLGIILSIFALTMFITIPEIGRVRGALAFTVILVGLAFSHPTSLFVIPAFFVIAWHESVSIRFAKTKVRFQLKEEWKAYLIPSIVLIVGMAVAVFLVRDSVFGFLSSVLFLGKGIPPTTSLGHIFTRGSMITVFDDDLAFIVLGMLSVMGMVVGLRSGRGVGVITWALFSVIISLFSSDWRFAYVLMPPYLLLSALGLHSLLTTHFSDRMQGVILREDKRWTITWASIIILLLFITDSRSMILLTDVMQFQSLAQDQESVYNAIIWSGSNLSNTTVISNTWQYSVYFDTLTKSERVTAQYFEIRTTADMDYLAGKGYHYYTMTNVTIAGETLSYLNASGTFKEIWTDGLTKVYTYSVSVHNASGSQV